MIKYFRQRRFIRAWVASGFRVNEAMRKVNISASTFLDWKQEKKFLQRVLREIKRVY